MLPAAAARFAPGIEAGYDFAFRIEHLRLAVDPKAAIGIEYANSCSSREERRRVDAVQDRFFEVVVHAFRSKLVVSPGRLLQVFEGHFLVRMPHDFTFPKPAGWPCLCGSNHIHIGVSFAERRSCSRARLSK